MLMAAIAIVGLLLTAITCWFTWKAAREARDDLSISPRQSLNLPRINRVRRPPLGDPFQVDIVPDEYVYPRLRRYKMRILVLRHALRSTFRGAPRTDIPGWAFVFLGPGDAERYRKEWGAHLWELIEADELKHARRDRRRLICVIFWLALVIRAHRVLTRARAR
jgi:hypothetical protein